MSHTSSIQVIFCVVSHDLHLLQRRLQIQLEIQRDTGIWTEKERKHKCLILILRRNSLTVQHVALLAWLYDLEQPLKCVNIIITLRMS